MTTVTLIYPYFHRSSDNSIFRFPPLGLGYVAACLKKAGIAVELVDCTFLKQDEALEKVRRSQPRIIGMQVMFSMKEKALELARLLKNDCDLLVAGGPLPTSDPEEFLRSFDVVVVGEGEQTMLELVRAVQNGTSLMNVKGIAFREKDQVKVTPPRDFIKDLDSIAFPSREFFNHRAYMRYFKEKFGYTETSIITSRGCPFNCDFCSRPVFGNSFRSRTAANIVDEVEVVHKLGYERVWFADDCFTLDRKRLLNICDELGRRRANVSWECLSRVDTVDGQIAQKMKRAGCARVFFGIESGNDSILRIMKKQVTTKQAERAVHVFKKAGIQVGAFFILGYPGESSETVLDTVRFASSLPLDYLSFTFPYPIPGTPLFDRVKYSMISQEWKEPQNIHLIEHKLLFCTSFSETKLKFAIFKGMTQFYLRKYMGNRLYGLIGRPYEIVTDVAYKALD
jgi:anaerobic magnesium-protoporphyrin IX monomethyl ester cyclase